MQDDMAVVEKGSGPAGREDRRRRPVSPERRAPTSRSIPRRRPAPAAGGRPPRHRPVPAQLPAAEPPHRPHPAPVPPRAAPNKSGLSGAAMNISETFIRRPNRHVADDAWSACVSVQRPTTCCRVAALPNVDFPDHHRVGHPARRQPGGPWPRRSPRRSSSSSRRSRGLALDELDQRPSARPRSPCSSTSTAASTAPPTDVQTAINAGERAAAQGTCPNPPDLPQGSTRPTAPS